MNNEQAIEAVADKVIQFKNLLKKYVIVLAIVFSLMYFLNFYLAALLLFGVIIPLISFHSSMGTIECYKYGYQSFLLMLIFISPLLGIVVGLLLAIMLNMYIMVYLGAFLAVYLAIQLEYRYLDKFLEEVSIQEDIIPKKFSKKMSILVLW